MGFDNLVKRQSRFFQTAQNEAKLGAYYTDVSHASRIGRLFRWPDEQVCVLEPSVGDGAAVLACTKGCKQRKVYGVEINADTYNNHLKSNEHIYAICADFLNGVKISNQSFSFVFANPPYGTNGEGERLERLFVEKMHSYVCRMGMIALVVPYQCIIDEKRFLKPFFRRFTPLRIYKFDDCEYQKYHQVVIIAQKNTNFTYINAVYDAFLEKISNLDEIAYLPREDEECEQFDVLPSYDDKIQYFTTLVFDADMAAQNLRSTGLYKVFGDRGFPKKYESLSLGNPPVPLSKDNSYLMAMCGAGQGLAGSVENKDLHLQRGIVRNVVDREIRKLPDGKEELVETTHAKMVLVTVENNGTITVLE